MAECFDRAFRALHTAPTDLHEATRLVHDYRRGAVAMTCEQPDCTGSILDGYCDLCGMAPRRRDAPVAAAARRPSPPRTR